MSKEFQIRDGNLIASFDLENEDGDIDFCKLLKVSHDVAEEIGMFVDYVATNKIIKDQSKKIADLETKLAEKDKQLEYFSKRDDEQEKQLEKQALFHRKSIKELKQQLAESENQCRECKHLNKKIELNIKNKLMAENCELQKQLAEKEKEIESLKHFKVTIGTMETNQVDISSTTYIDQDKISFCIEQLEKVKKFTEKEIKECNKLLQEEFEDDYYIQSVNARQSMCYEFKREIDNQIKQLNEGK